MPENGNTHSSNRIGEVPQELWLRNIMTINFIAIVLVCVVAVTLLIAAFGDELLHMKPDRGSVSPWAGSIPVQDKIKDGIHVKTGLVYAKGFDAVRANCTICHSSALITQNRASREGWKQMIRWMQATQGLSDLGTQETVILDYLATNYAPTSASRRPQLDQQSIAWYRLD